MTKASRNVLPWGGLDTRSLYIGLLGIWIGSALFFTFVVTTTLFQALPDSSAILFLGAIFPRFYAFTSAAGLLAVGALVQSGEGRGWTVALPALAVVLELVSWIVLLPMVNAAVGKPSFGALHGLSLGLDVVFTVLVAMALISAIRQKSA